jgi:outer membrane protein assembly factor BamB
MFKSNPQLTANSQCEFPYPERSDAFLSLWTKDLSTEIYASPIAAYGDLVCAGKSGKVFFLNQSNGAITKQISLGKEIIYTPAANSIFICIATLKALHSMILMPEKQITWEYELTTPNEFFSSHLVTEGDSIYLNAFNQSKKEFQVYRFLPSHKEPVWKCNTFPSRESPTTPIIVGDYLLVGTSEGNILVLDKREGKCRAELQEGGIIQVGINVNVAPAFSSQRAYFFDKKGALYSVQLVYDDSLKIKNYRLNSFETSFVYDFALSESERCMLIGFDDGVIKAAIDGSPSWHTKGYDLGNMKTTPVFCGKVGLVGGEDGYIYCFDLTRKQHPPRYEKLYFSERGHKLYVVAANKMFFVVSDHGKVGAYTLKA